MTTELDPATLNRLKDIVANFDYDDRMLFQRAQREHEEIDNRTQKEAKALWENASERLYTLMSNNPNRAEYFDRVDTDLDLDPNAYLTEDIWSYHIRKLKLQEQAREEAEYQLERRRSAFRRE